MELDKTDVFYILRITPILSDLCEALKTVYESLEKETHPHIFKSVPSMAKYLLERKRITPEEYLIIRGFFAEINHTELEMQEFSSMLVSVQSTINNIKADNGF